MDINETTAWVKRLQTGDDSAFDALFAAYQKQAVRTAALIIGEVSLAEDVAQEAFVSCLLHIKDLKEPPVQAMFFPHSYQMCMESYGTKDTGG